MFNCLHADTGKADLVHLFRDEVLQSEYNTEGRKTRELNVLVKGMILTMNERLKKDKKENNDRRGLIFIHTTSY